MNYIKKIVEWFEKKKKISFVILIAILSLMTYFSSIPGSSIGVKLTWLSVVYHFSIFAMFAFFFSIVISRKKLEKKQLIIALFVSILVAILDEFHQYFVPLRNAGLEDILTDSIGALFSIGLYFLIKKSK